MGKKNTKMIFNSNSKLKMSDIKNVMQLKKKVQYLLSCRNSPIVIVIWFNFF